MHILLSKPVQKKREKTVKYCDFHSMVAAVSPIFYDTTPRQRNQFKTFHIYIVPSSATVWRSQKNSSLTLLGTYKPLTIRPICSFETSETDYPVTHCHFKGTPSFEICGSSCSEVRLRWWGLRPWRSLQLCRLEGLYKSYSSENQWHNFKHNSVQNSIADVEEAHSVAGTVCS